MFLNITFVGDLPAFAFSQMWLNFTESRTFAISLGGGNGKSDIDKCSTRLNPEIHICHRFKGEGWPDLLQLGFQWCIPRTRGGKRSNQSAGQLVSRWPGWFQACFSNFIFCQNCPFWSTHIFPKFVSQLFPTFHAWDFKDSSLEIFVAQDLKKRLSSLRILNLCFV